MQQLSCVLLQSTQAHFFLSASFKFSVQPSSWHSSGMWAACLCVVSAGHKWPGQFDLGPVHAVQLTKGNHPLQHAISSSCAHGPAPSKSPMKHSHQKTW